MADGVVKPYYDAANQLVDEQAIQDKFNAATIAQFNAQREQNRQAENQFYNQMYNTQRTAMDTIRQANAAAVSTGASRGVQAANELSALLGLEQESVASATELAQANRQTAQEETAAMLENALNAYQQAAQERSQLVSQGIEAASLQASQDQASAAKQQAKTDRDKYLMDLKVNDPDKYYTEIANDNMAASFEGMSPEQFEMNRQIANNAINEISEKLGYNWNDFAPIDFGEQGRDKPNKIKTSLQNLYTAYGLDKEDATRALEGLNTLITTVVNNNKTNNQNTALPGKKYETAVDRIQKRNVSDLNLAAKEYLIDQFNAAYKLKYTISNE